MKQTAVEWLIKNCHIIPKNELNKRDTLEQAKEMEKQQQDKFAIEFGKWLENLTEDFYSKNDECSYSELLEIFKKEQFKNK
jgi:hypothetical protein